MADCKGYTGRYIPGMWEFTNFASTCKDVTRCTIEAPRTGSGKHASRNVGIQLPTETYLNLRCKDSVLVATVNDRNQSQTARLHTSDPAALKKLITERYGK
jgi:hypothetical protein